MLIAENKDLPAGKGRLEYQSDAPARGGRALLNFIAKAIDEKKQKILEFNVLLPSIRYVFKSHHCINNNTINMGIFWDLMQQSKIEAQEAHANSLEERVRLLEMELAKTRELLSKTLIALEEHIKVDIDGDGKMGR